MPRSEIRGHPGVPKHAFTSNPLVGLNHVRKPFASFPSSMNVCGESTGTTSWSAPNVRPISCVATFQSPAQLPDPLARDARVSLTVSDDSAAGRLKSTPVAACETGLGDRGHFAPQPR